MGRLAAPRRELGRQGEALAAKWYEEHGFTVVARNWSCRAGEVDIVARRGSLCVFCEVKTRSSLAFGWPAEAVGPSKQARLRRLAAMWLASARSRQGAPWGPLELRFDVASVIGQRVELTEGAF